MEVFSDLYAYAQTQVLQNDVFAGLAGASVLASLLYMARSVPGLAWQLGLNQLTCIVTVHNDDEAFDWLEHWLATTTYATAARRLQLSSKLYVDGENVWSLAPGAGTHLFWHDMRPVVLRREAAESSSGGNGRRRESITVRTLGRGSAQIRGLIERARERRAGGDKVEVYQYTRYWRRVANKRRRPVESIVLPTGQVEGLIADAERFFASEAWYAERGVPWRRGYLLTGEPGCGKTSLVLALAGYFKRPIYALNLGSVMGDDDLFSAIAEVPQRAILLIEDIDATGASKKRQRPAPVDVPANAPSVEGGREPAEITLSGLLNALDGVASVDGRLLVMTTNHPEKLDPALVRPGRADLHQEIGPLCADDARRLFLRFYPGEYKAADQAVEGAYRPRPAAELQGVFLQCDDARSAVEMLRVDRQRRAA